MYDKNIEMDCIFRKHENGVELIDFLHVSASENSRTTTSDNNQSDKDGSQGKPNSPDQSPHLQYSGVYDNQAPLIGYTTT